MRNLKRFGFDCVPVRFDQVLPEGASKKTVKPVLIVPSAAMARMIADKRFAVEVNHPDIRIGTTVYLNKKRVRSDDYGELAKVVRFVKAPGPRRVVLDRPLGGSSVWNTKDLLVL